MSIIDELRNLDKGRTEMINAGILPAVTPATAAAASSDPEWLPSAWPPVTAKYAQATAAQEPTRATAPRLTDLAAVLSRGYGLEGALVQGTLTGPTVTTVLVALNKGAKAGNLSTREADLARDLGVDAVRILGSVPGYPGCVGVEVPNKVRGTVGFEDTLMAYRAGSCVLPVVLGATSTGRPVTLDLAAMPHLLVAGTTGSGKSVFLHGAVCSIASLMKPGEVEIHLVDPKRVEFREYRNLPHLGSVIATEPRQAQQTLLGLADEMDRRYALLEKEGFRDIAGWNAAHRSPMSYQVLIVDEYGDLMMQGGDPRAMEDALIRIAQKARAVGIHAIVASQKLTGVVSTKIRENFPARLTFKVADERSASRRAAFGPEDLLGKGDLLLAGASGQPQRIQGAWLSQDTVKKTVRLAALASASATSHQGAPR
jgi:S-DNA-T family DNA segregation ATPase FtsK/SpoIIIE